MLIFIINLPWKDLSQINNNGITALVTFIRFMQLPFTPMHNPLMQLPCICTQSFYLSCLFRVLFPYNLHLLLLSITLKRKIIRIMLIVDVFVFRIAYSQIVLILKKDTHVLPSCVLYISKSLFISFTVTLKIGNNYYFIVSITSKFVKLWIKEGTW